MPLQTTPAGDTDTTIADAVSDGGAPFAAGDAPGFDNTASTLSPSISTSRISELKSRATDAGLHPKAASSLDVGMCLSALGEGHS